MAGLFDKLLCYDYGLAGPRSSSLLSGNISPASRGRGLRSRGSIRFRPSIDALAFSLDDVALSALPKFAICSIPLTKLGFLAPVPNARGDARHGQEQTLGRRPRPGCRAAADYRRGDLLRLDRHARAPAGCGEPTAPSSL